MNSLFVIQPYKYLDLWVFDDEARGLVQEPFVGGADTLIDVVTEGFGNADSGFKMIFSAGEFPGADYHLRWVRPDLSGNVYECQEPKMEAWLCPALLRYFESPPKELFVKVEAKKS